MKQLNHCIAGMKKTISLLALLALTNVLFGQSLPVSNFIDSIAKKNNFNGTILINQNSKISYQKSFGLANFQFKVPNRNETKYKIASITKLFTSVLLMQLYEEKKIDVNKTIKNYLPDYKGEGADKVTLHQLLNHTSGLANLMDTITSMESALKFGVASYQLPNTSSELLSKYCSGKLVNEPGKVFSYSNSEYIIIGKIIEKIYNKTYDQILHEKILNPLRMQDSGIKYNQNIIEGLADTYFYREDLKQMVNDLPVYTENWFAAGAMYSTANDILKFSNALFSLKLLKQETLNKMFVSGLDEYGYGVWVYEDYEIKKKMYKIIKRPGQIMGTQAMLFHVLNEGTTIIILSNAVTASLDEFVAEIAKRAVR